MSSTRTPIPAEETISLYCREHFEDILHNFAVDDIDRAEIMKKFASSYLKHLRMTFDMIPPDANNQNKKLLTDVFTCIKSLYSNFDLYSALIFNEEIQHNSVSLMLEMPDYEEREAFVNEIELIFKKYQQIMNSFRHLTFLPPEDFTYELEICPNKMSFTYSPNPAVASIESETVLILQKAFGFSLKETLEDQFTTLSLYMSALKSIARISDQYKKPGLLTTAQIGMLNTLVKLSYRISSNDVVKGFAYISKAANLLRLVVNYPSDMTNYVNEAKSSVLRCQINMRTSHFLQISCTHARHIHLLNGATKISATITEPNAADVETRRTIISSLALTYCLFGIYFTSVCDYRNAEMMLSFAFETNNKSKELNLDSAFYQVPIVLQMLNLLTQLSAGSTPETSIKNLLVYRQQLSWIPVNVMDENSVPRVSSNRLLCFAYQTLGRKELAGRHELDLLKRAKTHFKQAGDYIKLVNPAVKSPDDLAMEQSVYASVGEVILRKLKYRLERDEELYHHPFVRQEKIAKVMQVVAKVHPLNLGMNLPYAKFLKNIAMLIQDIASLIEDGEDLSVDFLLKAIMMMRYSIERTPDKDFALLLSFQKQLLSYTYLYIQASERPPQDGSFHKYAGTLANAYSELKKIAKDDLDRIDKFHLNYIKNELRMLKFFDIDFIEMTLSDIPISKHVIASFFKPFSPPHYQGPRQDAHIFKDLINPGFLPSLRMALLTIMNRTKSKPKDQNDIVESVYNIQRIDKLLETPACQSRRFSI